MAIPKSGKISLSGIVVNFKPNQNESLHNGHSISEYYRGGSNVKNFLGNLKIPVGPSPRKIAFSDFYGTGLQTSYDFPVPELCTDSFYTYGKDINDWNDVQDKPKEYIGRDNTEASIAIPIYHPQATVEIPRLEFTVESELGGDTKFERLFISDPYWNDTTFKNGIWQLIIPKKFKRFRIIITSAGGSGSTQKLDVNEQGLSNKLVLPESEDGYDGGQSKVWMNCGDPTASSYNSHRPFKTMSIMVQGGLGGGRHGHIGSGTSNTLSNLPTVIIVGGTETSLTNKQSSLPKDALNYTDILTFSNNNIIDSENIPAPINIIYRPKNEVAGNSGYKTSGATHSPFRPDGQGGESLFSLGGTPGVEYINGNDDISGNLNRVGNIIQLNDLAYGAGGAAGQHGGRLGNNLTFGGQAGTTSYLGDFECDSGDIINIHVGAGGRDSWNQYDDLILETKTDNFSGTVAPHTSQAGWGGNGAVQIIGSHGFLSSTMTHPGWVLEDENGAVVAYSLAGGYSIRGETLYQNSQTSAKSVELLGTSDSDIPKMYYLRFTARISKNGDYPMKTKFCHIGKKSVTVTALAKTIFENPVTGKLPYIEAELGRDNEEVRKVSNLNREGTDSEIIENAYTPTCNVRLTQDTTGSVYINSAKFVKEPLTDRGIGPDSFTIGQPAGIIVSGIAGQSNTVEFKVAETERYVLSKANLQGTGREVDTNKRLMSRVSTKNILQLDEDAGDGPQSADVVVTYSGFVIDADGVKTDTGGMGGFYSKSITTYFSCGSRVSLNERTNVQGTTVAHQYRPPVSNSGGSQTVVVSNRKSNDDNGGQDLRYSHYEPSTGTTTHFSNGITVSDMFELRNDQPNGVFSIAGSTSGTTYGPVAGDSINDATGNNSDGSSSGSSGQSEGGTHCCTAAENRNIMTFTEVKKLRAWHRKQSTIWQEGYDIWGKVIADSLISKSDWSSRRVVDYYKHKIYGKRTIGSTLADIVIYPISMIIGTYLCISKEVSKLFGQTKSL